MGNQLPLLDRLVDAQCHRFIGELAAPFQEIGDVDAVEDVFHGCIVGQPTQDVFCELFRGLHDVRL